MTAKNRTTLKNYFNSGSLPSEDQFENLIDSMLNMRDEGFEKSPEQGFKVAQRPEGRLISFFENIPIESPIWSVKIDRTSDNRKLTFLNKNDEEILTLTPDGMVGIKQNKPGFDLDVAGTIASHGRLGEKGAKTVHANGYWQDITDVLAGCNAFEIMAGVGKQKSGKYALLHAFALNTFNGKGGIFNRRGKIVYHQAHYGSRCNRLKLRWKKGSDKDYKLQLKTGCAYGSFDKEKFAEKAKRDVGVYVKYYITNLWFDEEMQGPRLFKEKILSRIQHRGAGEDDSAKLDKLSKEFAYDLKEYKKKESELKNRIPKAEVLIKGQKDLEDFSYKLYHYTGLAAKNPGEYTKEEIGMEELIWDIYEKIKKGLRKKGL
jgi:hypothetical protein